MLALRFRPSQSSTKIETFPTNLPSQSLHTEVQGLRPGVFYQFWVTATNDRGEGRPSQIEGLRIALGGTKEGAPIELTTNFPRPYPK